MRALVIWYFRAERILLLDEDVIGMGQMCSVSIRDENEKKMVRRPINEEKTNVDDANGENEESLVVTESRDRESSSRRTESRDRESSSSSRRTEKKKKRARESSIDSHPGPKRRVEFSSFFKFLSFFFLLPFSSLVSFRVPRLSFGLLLLRSFLRALFPPLLRSISFDRRVAIPSPPPPPLLLSRIDECSSTVTIITIVVKVQSCVGLERGGEGYGLVGRYNENRRKSSRSLLSSSRRYSSVLRSVLRERLLLSSSIVVRRSPPPFPLFRHDRY